VQPPRQFNLGPLEWNPPPPGFDPLTASNDVLDRYHLPLRPDPDRTRESYANWIEMMSPPIHFIQAAREQVFTRLAAFRLRPQTPASAQLEFSPNWSGGYIRPFTGSFASVEGLWRVNDPQPPPGPLVDGDYRASVWVGLDGHDPASPTLPQIGTLHEVVVQGGVPQPAQLSAWWQWWLRDVPGQAPISINGFPIAAEDRIRAKVIILGRSSARFFLKNMTNGTAAGFDWVDPNNQLSLLEGLTAEWIVERPTRTGGDQLYVLADYQPFTMRRCNATVGTGSGSYDQDLIGAATIRLAAWDDPVQPGQIVSTPRLLGRDRLLMRYGDFGP
jgi:hypothetical protein